MATSGENGPNQRGLHPMGMRWSSLAFLHWAVSPDEMNRWVPAGLELDTFDGQAWLGVVPFAMSKVRLRGLPAVPGLSGFLELNVRTYVRNHAGEAGVLFYSLDANHRLGVRFARRCYGLPYFDSVMQMTREDSDAGWVQYDSRRTHRDAKPALFSARYRAADGADFAVPEAGTLADFVSNRYALFTAGVSGQGEIRRAGVRHEPWQLAEAKVDLRELDMTRLLRMELREQPDVVHVARPLDVVATLPG